MRPLLLTMSLCIGLYATLPTNPSDIRLITRLDEAIQRRFTALPITTLGMSRVVQPSSFGAHFQPGRTAERDFQPSGSFEEGLIADMEKTGLQVGFYLFGTAIEKSAPDALNFRALKGPGAITHGTPRPQWYPGMPGMAPFMRASSPDALPDWKTIYPLARKAMANFQEGGKGVETTFASWHIAARPIAASQQVCLSCHHTSLNQPIGGVLYAYRRR